MAIRKELLDKLIKDSKSPEDLLGKHGLLKELSKGLVERMLQGEMTHHLGYEKHAVEGRNGGNSRNGSTVKRVQTGQGELALQVPRDREGKGIVGSVAVAQRGGQILVAGGTNQLHRPRA